VTAADLLDIPSAGGGEPGAVTDGGLRGNVSVGVRYLEAWLRGIGAVALDHLMEDAATAEISRSQIWQWLHNAVELDTGETVSADRVRRIVEEVLDALRQEIGPQAWAGGRFEEARVLFERVALADDFVDFLTLPAYQTVLAIE
jgi:malate synthase